MWKTVLGCLLAAVAGVSFIVLQDAQAQGGGKGKAKDKGPEPCERACLEGFVNQYLDALVAHNPFGLPLASKVKFSENDQVLDLGDGLWNVTTGFGKYKLIVADPQSQQVGFLGTVLANDRPTTLALRLKLENRKISEIETLVTVSNPAGGPVGPGGATGAAALDALGSPDTVFAQAEGQKNTREQLIASANAYFDALERGDAGLALFDPQCNRIENGVQVTNNPTPAGSGRGGAAANTLDPRALGCAEQISSRAFANYQVIYPRRIPVVDEERQAVFGFFMHQQPGDLLQVESPGKGVYKFSEAASTPGFVDVAQVFKFVGGRIRRMEAMTTSVPYGTPNPFFGDDWRRTKQK
ncbi:MAG: hypothetical protein ABI811_07685 [Acidobacteriota bacterium]